MSVAAGDIKKAQDTKVTDAVLPSTKSPNQSSSGQEPPSGFQGKGTVDEPYDQGNQPEQTTGPGTEPPAGKQGAGTVDQPYDQGNQPEQNKAMSIVDELSRTKTKDEIAQKRASRRESRASEALPQPPASAQSPVPSQAPVATQPIPVQVTEAPRGRDQANSVTTSTSSADGADLAPKRSRPQFERSVSPGQLPDGSHVKCSGERGEAYSPPTGLSKFKNKILH